MIVRALLLLLILVVGYLFVFFPIMMIIRCAISDRSRKHKAIWITVMVLFFGLGAYIYALFVSQNLRHQITAFTAIAIIGLVFLIDKPLQHQAAELYKDQALQTLEVLENTDLPPNYQTEIESALDILRQDLAGGFWQAPQKIRAAVLIDSLHNRLRDDEMSITDYMEWIEEFSSRQSMPPQRIRDFIRRQHTPGVSTP